MPPHHSAITVFFSDITDFLPGGTSLPHNRSPKKMIFVVPYPFSCLPAPAHTEPVPFLFFGQTLHHMPYSGRARTDNTPYSRIPPVNTTYQKGKSSPQIVSPPLPELFICYNVLHFLCQKSIRQIDPALNNPCPDRKCK